MAEITVEPGEPTKRLEIVSQCYDRLVDLRADRRKRSYSLSAAARSAISQASVAATYNAAACRSCSAPTRRSSPMSTVPSAARPASITLRP